MRGTWQTTDSGGGGLVFVAVIVALALGSGAASAAVSALVTIAIIIACLVGAAMLGSIALLVYRARSELGRSEPRRGRVSAPVIRQAGPAAAPELSSEHKPAIEPPREIHIHLHLADPAEAAEIIRTAIPGTAGDVAIEGK